MPLTMYDTVTVDTVPANPQAVAGYVDGRWPTYNELVSRFPSAHHLSITVFGSDADCCDCEAGDMSVDSAVTWVQSRLDAGAWRPVVYANEDRWKNQGLEAKLAHHGNRIRRWMAQYDDRAEIPAGYDGKQFTSSALGRNLDQSIVADDFFAPKIVPPPPLLNYAILTPTERKIVLHYDGARKHPIRYRAYLVLLRAQLRGLAYAVLVAHLRGGWNIRHRGTRYQMLIKRANGQQIAK